MYTWYTHIHIHLVYTYTHGMKQFFSYLYIDYNKYNLEENNNTIII